MHAVPVELQDYSSVCWAQPVISVASSSWVPAPESLQPLIAQWHTHAQRLTVPPLCVSLTHCTPLQVGGMCAPGALCVSGTSAGGWLAASAALQAPHLFRSLVLTVPCLDPLGLMLQQRQGRVELGDAANSPRVGVLQRSLLPRQHWQPDATALLLAHCHSWGWDI